MLAIQGSGDIPGSVIGAARTTAVVVWALPHTHLSLVPKLWRERAVC